MKKRTISGRIVFFFVLALILIVTGMAWGIEGLQHFEYLAQTHESHEQLEYSMQLAALDMMLFGSMVASGIGILVILFLHMIRSTSRIRREAEALREKNKAIEALNQQTQKLAHHQRLETIGTLTSSIAHEFNNLLTPIMGYSLMALEKLPPEEESLYDDILEIYNASRKAKTIISRLSDLARKNNSMSFREVSVDDVVQKILVVATPAKPAKVQVKVDLNCWDQRIFANEIQLNQLLLNLILNSFHAMEEGGSLTITTNFDETYVHIQVEDTGCGIPEEIKPRIFEPFFTTKETGKGTGLGLAIVAQIVEDHQGKIDVKSQEEEGTAITISLPRTAQTAILE